MQSARPAISVSEGPKGAETLRAEEMYHMGSQWDREI